MSEMVERVARAIYGEAFDMFPGHKGGAQRRIVITMDESMFYQIRELAKKEHRSISNAVVSRLEHALTSALREEK